MNNWMRIDLNGTWKIFYIAHDKYCKMETEICSYQGVTGQGENCIDAEVPGNFELDLQRAGKIQDPFFGKNILALQDFEDCHIFYARKFDYKSRPGMIPQIVFEGIDTLSEIYLNGELLAYTDNMFIQYKFELDNLLKEGENEIVVHLLPVCIETRKNKVSAGNFALKYNYETLRLRKAPHMFGWDIMPRAVSAGLYRPVYLEYRPMDYFRQVYFMTEAVDLPNQRAEMEVFFDVNVTETKLAGYTISIYGTCGTSSFNESFRLWFTSGKHRFTVKNAKFWWPKGYGGPNLYEVTVELKKDDKVIDIHKVKVGIRTVKLVRTGVTDIFFNGKFHFEINGKKVFVLGTNWVPADAFHSRDRSRIPEIMKLVDDIGCNTIRCWGGNVYEDELFYDACDEMGIMIWQDFALACGIYPIDDDFCKVMENEAISIVRHLRHHSSIILWSGDNECDVMVKHEKYGRDPNINKITRQVLPEVVAFEDPTRPYLPSSPFVDEEAHKLPVDYLTENHLWGPRDYYKSNYYINSLCNFASEIGYHGCPSVESMSRFISKEKMWPWNDNDEWILHAASPETDPGGSYTYRIELMAKQIKELFGTIPDNLNDFVIASQISQAEAKKFFIELFRSSKWNRTGIIWWNLIDGWPQFSDAVVDYYYNKKLAYHYIKQSQKPLILCFTEPKNWNITLKAVNDTPESLAFSYIVKDYTDHNNVVLQGKKTVEADAAVEIDKLAVSRGEKKIYVIQWECGNLSGINHYLSGNPPFELNWYMRFLKEVYKY